MNSEDLILVLKGLIHSVRLQENILNNLPMEIEEIQKIRKDLVQAEIWVANAEKEISSKESWVKFLNGPWPETSNPTIEEN